MMGHLSGRPDLTMLQDEAERRVVAKALEKDPRHRWPSCREFVEALAQASPPVRRPWLPLALAAALPVIAAAVVGVVLWITRTPPPPVVAPPAPVVLVEPPQEPPTPAPVKVPAPSPTPDKPPDVPSPPPPIQPPQPVKQPTPSTTDKPSAETPAPAPTPAKAPFDAAEAKRVQQEWADYLGVPVLREAAAGGVDMKLALIPSGTLQMGSPVGEADRFDNEGPQHPVEIGQPYYLGVYPVTKGQFAAFVKDDGYQTEAERAGDKETWRNPGFLGVPFDQTDDDPVVEVSWNDAVKYCEWLSKKEGKSYELPTEAEWEAACRAGTTTAYSFGDDPKLLGDYAWYTDNSEGHTHPVGGKKPNPWGLYDMHGNVWQWCADWYGKYTEKYIKDPRCADSRGRRVLRGGSWFGAPRFCRSAYRTGGVPGVRGDGNGFRVVLRVLASTP